MMSDMSSNQEIKLSVILPTYDESENVGPLIDSLIHSIGSRWTFEIIVVDDNSPDGTWKIVEEKGRLDPRVRIIRRMNERGLTSALNEGIHQARGEVVSWMDCDFQHPPEKLPSFMDKIDEGWDAVIGSRFLSFDSGDHRLNKKGSLLDIIRVHGKLSAFLSIGTRWILGFPFTDWTSGYIALKRDFFQGFKLEGDYGEYFMILLYRIQKTNRKFIEIPYILQLRERGYSKTSTGYAGLIFKGIKYVIMVFRMKLKYKG